jgi:hypothetical protein
VTSLFFPCNFIYFVLSPFHSSYLFFLPSFVYVFSLISCFLYCVCLPACLSLSLFTSRTFYLQVSLSLSRNEAQNSAPPVDHARWAILQCSEQKRLTFTSHDYLRVRGTHQMNPLGFPDGLR